MKKLIKALPIIFLLCFVVTCVSINVLAEENTGEIGDVNYDGKINATDALEILKHAAKITTIDTTYADIDRNGSVNATDALWVLKLAAKIIPDLSLETINATPTPSPTPVPVAENIAKLKKHIKTNGYTEGTISYIPYSVSDDDSLYTYMVYYGDKDLLQMELTYYTESTSGEVSEVDVFMPITGNDTDSIFFVGYEGDDYSGYLEAKATIDISTITYSSKINYTIEKSYNIDSSQLPNIFENASSMTTDSLMIWNEIINEEVGFGLKELGFSKL